MPGITTDLHVRARFSTGQTTSTSRALAHVPPARRRAGDLVFWNDPVTHVAVYLGDDRIVEAVRPRIRTASLWAHGTPRATVVRPFP